MEAVRLRIADKYFFDNAELLLPSIKDAAGGLLEDGVNAWLTQIYNLTPKTHKDRGVARSGYDAKELNGALREKMNVISGIHKETCVDCGALLSKGKEGFDFSLFDEEYNIVKLRNAFVGNPGRYDGEEILKTINKRVFKPSGDTYSKCEWREEIASLGGTLGKNISHQKNRYKTFARDLFYAFNNFHIRHNNADPQSPKFKKPIGDLAKEQLEFWYDEVYQMCLLAILRLEHADRKKTFEALKSEIENKTP